MAANRGTIALVPPGPEIDWVFDPLPPSRGRRGGEPAGHAFRHHIDAFVREVVQNANDQRLGDAEVHFRLRTVAGAALEDFLGALAWPTLEAHLRAAVKSPSGRAIADALSALQEHEELTLLQIEDRNTVGLVGDELEGESNFRALARDVLFSHKQDDTAGGSYGLGKSVLWTFSEFRTVVFHSVLSKHERGQVSPRLIGRAELGSHTLPNGDGFQGPGWFGRVVEDDRGRRAESVWGVAARQIAAKLGIDRRDEAGTGTSILVVGFRDPTTDEAQSITVLSEAFRSATVRHFWPALFGIPGRPLVVWVATPDGGSPVRMRDAPECEPFQQCYAQRADATDRLERPGDVVVREIPVEVPGLRPKGKAVRGSVRLCVRHAADAETRLQGHIALFRGPGMVVTYRDKRRIALAARPFHAVLACGLARAPEAPTEADRAIDAFLRAAEPPGHDAWHPTDNLRQRYQRGFRKAIDDLFRAVDKALREIVVPSPRHGAPGPDLLRRRFPVGRSGTPPRPEPPVFTIRDLEGRFGAGRWHFTGTISPENLPDGAKWRCTVRLFEVDADGKEVAPIPIETFETDPAAAAVHIDDGRATVDAGKHRSVLHFAGTSNPLPAGDRITVALEVEGHHG
ncbi:MAG: hypothetical protein D6705_08560 [Deltaproteobacteria bacterium]|nr:MAG: hypothetical protein D6705_08560 [Deltaproteobacteria bacterium]